MGLSAGSRGGCRCGGGLARAPESPSPASSRSSIVNVPGESTLRRDFLRLQQENKERSEALRRQQLLQEQQLREQEEYKRQLLAERQKRIEQQKEQRRRLEEVEEDSVPAGSRCLVPGASRRSEGRSPWSSPRLGHSGRADSLRQDCTRPEAPGMFFSLVWFLRTCPAPLLILSVQVVGGITLGQRRPCPLRSESPGSALTSFHFHSGPRGPSWCVINISLELLDLSTRKTFVFYTCLHLTYI